jgi:hypothetical protein
MMRMAWPVGLSLALSLPSCDGAEAPDVAPTDVVTGVETGADAGPAADAPAGQGTAPACRDLPPGRPLTPGLWASRQRITGLVGLPPTGTLTPVTTTLLVLHDVVEDRGETRVTHRTCSLSQPRMSGVETVFRPEFVAGVPRNTVTATIDGDRVTFPRDRVILGAELAEPDTDALPTAAEDPRVIDGDGDGNPGMTVVLQGLFQAQLYITYRHFIALEGTSDAVGCVSGVLKGAIEQTQLGASEDALLAFDFSPRPHPDPDINTFVLVPVRADLDCAALMAEETALFGP